MTTLLEHRHGISVCSSEKAAIIYLPPQHFIIVPTTFTLDSLFGRLRLVPLHRLEAELARTITHAAYASRSA